MFFTSTSSTIGALTTEEVTDSEETGTGVVVVVVVVKARSGTDLLPSAGTTARAEGGARGKQLASFVLILVVLVLLSQWCVPQHDGLVADERLCQLLVALRQHGLFLFLLPR
eukprot:TRINITY_DN41_c0_g1_i10.p2 TRINITY_DN41_c0_g1~~TRINITY_DN41_c0_g1_i10.p2  ORF type:complete len:112 (+),score=21.61 TRINITY_DN41_c0_g1_i10:1595-1930(+)